MNIDIDQLDIPEEEYALDDGNVDKISLQQIESLLSNLFIVGEVGGDGDGDGESYRINDTNFSLLMNFLPKVFVKALRLIEFDLMNVVIYNKDLPEASGDDDGDDLAGFGWINDEGTYVAMPNFMDRIEKLEQRLDILRLKYPSFEEIMEQQFVVIFKDVRYQSQDNDSDDEFIRDYNTQKTIYHRKEEMVEFQGSGLNKWNLEIEKRLGMAVNCISDEDEYQGVYKGEEAFTTTDSAAPTITITIGGSGVRAPCGVCGGAAAAAAAAAAVAAEWSVGGPAASAGDRGGHQGVVWCADAGCWSSTD
ncbi:hypothetical protein DASC09_035790 [Saccharomycopsis crataegensis]|uniref:Uncharacterized protein n=1 Tax=Saccharomycopsis crataegensis TaxID=43959 RepID=A0AAV5QP67_9ASCO|nr:hypothetical protein DASC09_035790 [Saccharomycopsis crataegensis]